MQAFDERRSRGQYAPPSPTGRDEELRALLGPMDEDEEKSSASLSDGTEVAKRVRFPPFLPWLFCFAFAFTGRGGCGFLSFSLFFCVWISKQARLFPFFSLFCVLFSEHVP